MDAVELYVRGEIERVTGAQKRRDRVTFALCGLSAALAIASLVLSSLGY